MTGEVGYKPMLNPNFDPGGPLSVCHDVFEHEFKNDFGEANFEIMAFGCALFCRPASMYVDRTNSIGAAFGQELAYQIDQYTINTLGYNVPKFNVLPGKPKFLSDEDEAEISKFMLHLEETISEGYDGGYAQLTPIWKEKFDEIPHWIRLGFRYAKRRFRECKRDEVQSAWEEMYSQLEKLYRGIGDLYGQYSELHVRMSNKWPVSFRLIEYEEEELYAH